jgi:hypothetical protein
LRLSGQGRFVKIQLALQDVLCRASGASFTPAWEYARREEQRHKEASMC